MTPPDRSSRYRTGSARPLRPSTNLPLTARATPPAPGTGLRGLLRTIDGGPFQAYRRILGEHELGDFRLTVLSVPPDALGGPARVRLSIERARAGLEGAWWRGDIARVVLEDAIVRAATRAIEEFTGSSVASAPGSGRVWIDPPGPDLVERTGARVGDETLDVSLAFDLPAAVRRVRGQQAEVIVFEHLPRVGMAALLFPLRRVNDLKPQVETMARRSAAAGVLSQWGLAALLPSAVLPGRTAPAAGLTTIDTPHGPVAGLAVPTGITVFVTAGVSGAGAWLRDLVAASGRAADGTAILAGPVATVRPSRRAFGPLDVRAFVRPCPEVPDPEAYGSDEAPAPLAVAASLVEAVEAGARVLVLDEDDIPAGALGRDGRMQRIVGGAPPLVPLTECLVDLRDRWGVSFLIAARATGGFCDAADTVFIVRGDSIEDATEAVRGVTRAAAGLSMSMGKSRALTARPTARSMRVVIDRAPAGLKVAAWGGRGVRVGEDLVDLSDTTLVGDQARLRTIAALLKRAAFEASVWRPVEEVLDALEAETDRKALDRLEEPGLVDLARPARIEIASALVRWKRVVFRVAAGTLRANAEDLP